MQAFPHFSFGLQPRFQLSERGPQKQFCGSKMCVRCQWWYALVRVQSLIWPSVPDILRRRVMTDWCRQLISFCFEVLRLPSNCPHMTRYVSPLGIWRRLATWSSGRYLFLRDFPPNDLHFKGMPYSHNSYDIRRGYRSRDASICRDRLTDYDT